MTHEPDIKESILEFFAKNKERYISGEDISEALNTSRASIWKYINKLRYLGYEIDAVPHLGYMLKSSPDKLFEYEIKHGLKSKILGQGKIYHYENTVSTNDKAYILAERGDAEGTLVIAEAQTGGRGRMGRKWVSPKGGGIYMSVILRPDIEADEIQSITLVAAASIVKAIKRETNVDAKIKWPNDVFIRDKKMCGVLTEIKGQADMINFVILGIGINVNTDSRGLPDEGISLKEFTGAAVNRANILRSVLEEFENDYRTLKKSGFAALRDFCKKHSLVLGKDVKINEHNKHITGQAVDIDGKGALVVRVAKNKDKRVFSGDVSLLK